MEKHKVIIHPGFHKTGTTYLQYQIFNNGDYFHQLGYPPEITEIFEKPSEFKFSDKKALKSVEDKYGFSDIKPNILSSETLCGNPFFGSREAKAMADRMYATFPSAKIFFTVRRQHEAARSMYKQYIKMGGINKAAAFFERESPAQFHQFDWETLDYGLLIEYYAQLFGDDNILVLPQEALKKNAESFFDEMAQFIGMEINLDDFSTSVASPSPSMWQLKAFKLSNLFIDHPLNPDLKFGPEIIGKLIRRTAGALLPNKDNRPDALDSIIQEGIGQNFQETNLILQKYCPIDLKQYGYLES